MSVDNYTKYVRITSPTINNWYSLSTIKTITTTNKNIELTLNNPDSNTLILNAKNVNVFNVSSNETQRC